MKVGVLVTGAADAGDLFADVRALETAGADSLWAAADGEIDPLVLLAAVAALTHRCGLAVLGVIGATDPDKRRVRTLALLARGRLRDAVGVASGDPEEVKAALARAPEGDRWVRIDAWRDRAHWHELRLAYTASGATGLIVPLDARTLDLVRNPDVIDDRTDLNMSVG